MGKSPGAHGECVSGEPYVPHGESDKLCGDLREDEGCFYQWPVRGVGLYRGAVGFDGLYLRSAL